jgi:hypothetical protein
VLLVTEGGAEPELLEGSPAAQQKSTLPIKSFTISRKGGSLHVTTPSLTDNDELKEHLSLPTISHCCVSLMSATSADVPCDNPTLLLSIPASHGFRGALTKHHSC